MNFTVPETVSVLNTRLRENKISRGMRMEGVKCSRFGPPIRFDLVLRDTSVEQSFGGTLQEMSE